MSEWTPNADLISILKGIVRAINADWCGVQDTIDPNQSLLLFTSRETDSTLAVKFNPNALNLIAEPLFPDSLLRAAQKKLAESNAKFDLRKIQVKASTLVTLRDRATDISLQIDQILGVKNVDKANS